MHDADLVARMVRAGGVHYNVSGKSPAEVFEDAVARLELPSGVIAADLVAGMISTRLDKVFTILP